MLGVVGDLVQDVVVWQQEPTQHATDTRSEIFNRRGGSAANVAAFAAPRYPTRFMGCVGADTIGSALAEELAGHGVDVRLQRRDKTGVVVVLVADTGERLMFPSRAASTRLEIVDEDWLTDLELLHCPGYGLDGGSTADAIRDAIRRVRSRGGLVSIDASSTGMIRAFGTEAFMGLLEDLEPDILSANEDECALLSLAVDGAAGPNLERLPSTIVLARAGADPTVVFEPARSPVAVPVPPVRGIRDVTGAGDAFNAGFLTAYLSLGRDAVVACEAGHALAARVLRSPGASVAGARPSSRSTGSTPPWPAGTASGCS